SRDRRERAAHQFAGRSAPQYLRVHRLPRRDQDQHAARFRQNGMAAPRTRRHRLSDELSARPPDRDALLDARNSQSLSPHLTYCIRHGETVDQPFSASAVHAVDLSLWQTLQAFGTFSESVSRGVTKRNVWLRTFTSPISCAIFGM